MSDIQAVYEPETLRIDEEHHQKYTIEQKRMRKTSSQGSDTMLHFINVYIYRDDEQDEQESNRIVFTNRKRLQDNRTTFCIKLIT